MNSNAQVSQPGQGTDSGYAMDSKSINDVFAELSASLEVDQTAFGLKIESEEQKRFYSPIFNNQPIEFLKNFRRDSSAIFINDMTRSFISLMVSSRKLPKKLAFKPGHDKLYIWAEVKEDDALTEEALILTSAKVDQMFQGTGFTVSLMYVEDRHNLSIPSNYNEVNLNPVQNAKFHSAHKSGKKESRVS